jgi:hypothetical protein
MNKVIFSMALLLGLAVVTAQAAEMKMAAPAAGKPDTKAGEGHAMKGADMTCGQMLASRAPIPEKLSEGALSVAEMLDAHATLMGKEKESQAEAKGMRAIAKSHRQVATELKKIADEMKKAASWPAAPHDMAKMTADPKLMAAQKRFIEVHKELIAMMEKAVSEMEAQHKAMPK